MFRQRHNVVTINCGCINTGFYTQLPLLFETWVKTLTVQDWSPHCSCRRKGSLQNFTLFRFVFRSFEVIRVTVKIFTVFTDVQLFEVNQAGDGSGQVGQVVIGHAQLLQGLAVEELLWKHRVETMEYYNPMAKSHRPLVGRYKRTKSEKVSWGHKALNVVEKQWHYSSTFL